jgi:hypothetical protein
MKPPLLAAVSFPKGASMADLTGVLGVMIPLSAIVLGIGLAFWSVYWEHQKKRLQYQERQLMIEKGLAPPPILPDEKKIVTPEASLRRGIILAFLGIGLAITAVVLANFGDEEDLVWIAGMASAIVGSLGLGNLAYYALARKQAKGVPDVTS